MWLSRRSDSLAASFRRLFKTVRIAYVENLSTPGCYEAYLIFTVPAAFAQLSGVDGKPQFIKVTDRVYCATGYALGNVIFVITDKSAVVIDTTEKRYDVSKASIRRALEEFRKSQPVAHQLYHPHTHHHGDHINGARAFKADSTRIIAQKELPTELSRLRMLAAYNQRLKTQCSSACRCRKLDVAHDLAERLEPGYVQPDILFDDKYAFEEGGVRLSELYHTLGETFDHLMVWMPGEQVLCPRVIFFIKVIRCWRVPMKPARPVLGWAESLDRMRQFHPAFLVGSHNAPLRGKEVSI